MSTPTKPETRPATLKSYTIGFVLSLIFTLSAYFLVLQHVNSHHEQISHEMLVPIILALAISQLVVQLVFFLHLGKESKPRWNLTVFSFMLLVLVIVVFGSLWIMNNLNYHMTEHPAKVDSYIIKDEGVHR